MEFSDLKKAALLKAGNQENLARLLSTSSSEISKKLNDITGWKGPEINTLLSLAGYTITDKKTVHVLKETMKILLNGEG